MLTSGNMPNPDIQMRPYEDIYRQRQVDLAVQIFQLMGIAREDREARDAWMQRGFRLFDAPVAIILSVDKSLDLARPLSDIGSLVHAICLAALNYGLGTCINGAGIMYSDVVRRFTGLPESKMAILCIAIGYPDWDFPANKLESTRVPIEDNTTWCGFE